MEMKDTGEEWGGQGVKKTKNKSRLKFGKIIKIAVYKFIHK